MIVDCCFFRLALFDPEFCAGTFSVGNMNFAMLFMLDTGETLDSEIGDGLLATST